MVRNLNLSKKRSVIQHLGQRYEINRDCPHQGGDLAYASIDDDLHVVCHGTAGVSISPARGDVQDFRHEHRGRQAGNY